MYQGGGGWMLPLSSQRHDALFLLADMTSWRTELADDIIIIIYITVHPGRQWGDPRSGRSQVIDWGGGRSMLVSWFFASTPCVYSTICVEYVFNDLGTPSLKIIVILRCISLQNCTFLQNTCSYWHGVLNGSELGSGRNILPASVEAYRCRLHCYTGHDQITFKSNSIWRAWFKSLRVPPRSC